MKIAILYHIPNNSIKYEKWHDGFTKAIELLKKDSLLEIDMINFFDKTDIELNNYNFVFIKWGFGSSMQSYCQKYFSQKGKKCKIGIFISSIKIPTTNDINFFDILFYETEWYKNYANLNRHSNIYHAFGIDTQVMRNLNIQKKYDYIFVGNVTDYKRPEKLIEKPGNKLVVGFLDNKKTVDELKLNGIEVKNFVEYNELSKLYNASRICYVPCRVDGGGERAVLEARACGLKVEIENDNKKLLELLNSDIYDSHYYANKIKRGIFDIINSNIRHVTDIYSLYSKSRLNIVQIGAMDGIKFDKLYPYIIDNEKVKAYLFEPVRYYFDKLVENYRNAEGHIVLLNHAISDVDGEIDFNVIDPEEIINNNLPEFLMGVSSRYNDRNSLGRGYWQTRGKIHTEKNGWTFENTIEKYIRKIRVKSMKASTFLRKYKLDQIDFLVVDAEGSDYHIIKDFLEVIRP